MTSGPSERAKGGETEARLVDQLSGILRSGVTRTALRTPSAMTIDDVVENLHLFERLYIAAMLVKQRQGYEMAAGWLADGFSVAELEAGLRAARRRRAPAR